MISRRDFIQFLAWAAGGTAVGRYADAEQAGMAQYYDLPAFGDISLLHITDMQFQFAPLYYREPSFQLIPPGMQESGAYLTGDQLLDRYSLMFGSAQAYAFSSDDYEASAGDFGRLGGIAGLLALIRSLRKSRKNALLLDGGNGCARWEPSWAKVPAAKEIMGQLAVDIRLATLADMHAAAIAEGEDGNGETSFTPALLAHNLYEPVTGVRQFPPYVLERRNGLLLAVIGQAEHEAGVAAAEKASASPGNQQDRNTLDNPQAHARPVPRVAKIDEAALQQVVDEVKTKGAEAVVLLSRAGIDADMRLASRIDGIDVILGGRSMTPTPEALEVSKGAGKTLVTNTGGQGRYLGVLDMRRDASGQIEYRYTLLPVIHAFLRPDPKMEKQVQSLYASLSQPLARKLAISKNLLYRRGSANGTADELLLAAMLDASAADLAIYPGFRWGNVVLPGHAITLADILSLTAWADPVLRTETLSGAQLHGMLENAVDGVCNRNPYQRRPLDLPRTAGIDYELHVAKPKGERVQNLRIGTKAMQPAAMYRVCGWGGIWEQLPVHMPAPEAESPEERAGREGRLEVGEMGDLVVSYLEKKPEFEATGPFKPKILVAENQSA